MQSERTNVYLSAYTERESVIYIEKECKCHYESLLCTKLLEKTRRQKTNSHQGKKIQAGRKVTEQMCYFYLCCCCCFFFFIVSFAVSSLHKNHLNASLASPRCWVCAAVCSDHLLTMLLASDLCGNKCTPRNNDCLLGQKIRVKELCCAWFHLLHWYSQSQ